VFGRAGGVDHKLLDQLEELRIVGGELAGQEAVNVVWGAELRGLIQKDDAVHMGKATLLELNHKNMTNHLAKDATLHVLDQIPALGLKCTNGKVWTVCWILTWEKSVLDLWPVGVGSHREKEVATIEVPVNRQRILEKLLHMTGAPCKRRRQDNPLTKFTKIGINIGCNGICKPRVQITANFPLAGHDEHESILLASGPMVAHPLLKELFCPKNMLGFDLWRARMKAIAIELRLGDGFAFTTTFLIVGCLAISVLELRMP
jgi:hypothetical protein